MANRTEPDAFARAERRDRAVTLRREGMTIREISAELEVAPSTAWADIKAALEAIPAENAEQLRQQEADRLDALQRAIWDAALAGDLHALDRVLKISDRRCRLLGLDLPARIEQATVDIDLDAAVKNLVAVAQGDAFERGG